MLHSFSIHEPQCRALYEARELTKPEKERRPCPKDPYAEGGAGGGFPGGKQIRNRAELDEVNAVAMAAWSTGVLEECRYCGRRFLPEKLAIHRKSCNASHPARRVNETVNRREALGLSTTGSQVVVASSSHGRYNAESLSRQLAHAAALATGNSPPQHLPSAAATVPAGKPWPLHRPKGLAIGEAGFSTVLDSPSLASDTSTGKLGLARTAEPSFALPRARPGQALPLAEEQGKEHEGQDQTQAPENSARRVDYRAELLKRKMTYLRAAGGLGLGLGSNHGAAAGGYANPQQSLSASAGAGYTSSGLAHTPQPVQRGGGGRRSITVLEESEPTAVPKWKRDSLQFRNALKLARRSSLADKAALMGGGAGAGFGGGDVGAGSAGSPETPEMVQDDRIECPHCFRRYAEPAAQRHVPLCRDIHANGRRGDFGAKMANAGAAASASSAAPAAPVAPTKPPLPSAARRSFGQAPLSQSLDSKASSSAAPGPVAATPAAPSTKPRPASSGMRPSSSSSPSPSAAAKAPAPRPSPFGAKPSPKPPVPISRRPSWKGVGNEFQSGSPRDDEAKKPAPSVIEVDTSAFFGPRGIGSGYGYGGGGGGGRGGVARAAGAGGARASPGAAVGAKSTGPAATAARRK